MPDHAPAAHQRPPAHALLTERRRLQRRLRRRRLGLWRSLGRSNRMFPRKLVVTREGKWIIGLSLLLGAGAVNTGNNLLYLVLSLLIAIISISGILSELNLKGVVVRRHYPRELTAGAPVVLRAEVENAKRRAALHLEVDELLDDDAALAQRPGYLLHLAPGERASSFAVALAPRRGPLSTVGLRLSTTFPFGFARKSIVGDAPAQLLVLPPVEAVTLRLPGGGGRGERERASRAGRGGELRGLRDLRTGDGARDVHWKVSARRDRLIAREWEDETARVVWLEFVHLSASPSAGPEALDRACAVVAGAAADLLRQGFAVGLRTFAGALAPEADPDGAGERLLDLRRHLAWLLPADAPPPPQWAADDARWLAAAEAATARLAALRAGVGLRLAGAGAAEAGAGARVRIAFASRAEVHLAGPPPTLTLWLADDGALREAAAGPQAGGDREAAA
jgi:uncharacterized protein (DUF58 family)